MTKRNGNAKRWLPLLLIILAGALSYANTLRNDFAYDDKLFIRDNPFVQDPGNISHLLVPADYYRLTREDNYIPVTTLSFFVNYALFGQEPSGYHFTNALFHVFNSLLVYLFVVITLKRRTAALICALLFATHPIHTESVTWVAGRTDVLSAFFFLISLILYVRGAAADASRRMLCYGGSLASFLVSLFAKEMSITLLPVIVLHDLCLSPAKGWENIRRRFPVYLAFLGITLAYLAGRVFIYSKGMEIGGYPGGSLSSSLLTMSKGIVFYLKLLVIPTNLSISHLIPVSVSAAEGAVIGSIAVITALLACAVALYRRSSEITFAVGFFFITLLPVCQLIPIPGGIVAERYLYIPSIGYTLFLAFLLDRGGWFGPKYVMAALALVVILYAAGTVTRNRDWKDETTLWTKALELYPGNGRAYLYRGHTYWEKGKYAEAIVDYTRAIEITPRDPVGYVSRGVSRATLGGFAEAISDFSRAIELDPGSARPFYNRGIAYSQQGRYGEALADFDRAIELDPGSAESYNNRGTVLARTGRYDEALKDFSRAIELNPRHAMAYQSRSKVYSLLGEEELSRRDAARARSLRAAPHRGRAPRMGR